MSWPVKCLLFIVFLAVTAWFGQRREDKWAVLQSTPSHQILSSKGQSPLQVKIEQQSSANAALHLRGVILSRKSVEHLKWQWHLPAGSFVLAGDQQGEWNHIAAMQVLTVEVTVKMTTTGNQQIHLQAFELIEGEHYGSMAQFDPHALEAMTMTHELSALSHHDTGRLRLRPINGGAAISILQ